MHFLGRHKGQGVVVHLHIDQQIDHPAKRDQSQPDRLWLACAPSTGCEYHSTSSAGNNRPGASRRQHHRSSQPEASYRDGRRKRRPPRGANSPSVYGREKIPGREEKQSNERPQGHRATELEPRQAIKTPYSPARKPGSSRPGCDRVVRHDNMHEANQPWIERIKRRCCPALPRRCHSHVRQSAHTSRHPNDARCWVIAPDPARTKDSLHARTHWRHRSVLCRW